MTEEIKSTFRKWGYKKGEAQIFDVDAADPKLPEGWLESPADLEDQGAQEEVGEDEFAGISKDELIAIAERSGVEVKKSWNIEKIKEALQVALDGGVDGNS